MKKAVEEVIWICISVLVAVGLFAFLSVVVGIKDSAMLILGTFLGYSAYVYFAESFKQKYRVKCHEGDSD